MSMKRNAKKMLAALVAILSAGLFLAGCPHGNTGGNNNPEKLLILQAYGNGPMDGNSPGGVSHSFVELYNPTDEEISLDGIGLYYADGTSTSTPDNTATEDGEWTRIALDGKTIPAGGSFLILGKKHTDISGTRHIIPDNYGDVNNNFILSRRAFKVALIRSTESLVVQNPFNTDGNGTKVSGYIDMVGAANEYSEHGDGRDRINGFEYEPARNSASEAVRRIDIKDYDDNLGDFESIRYALGNSKSISDELLEVRKPRNSRAGEWDPFAEPEEEPPPEGPFVEAGTQDGLAGKLLILQAYGSSSDAAGISHSFVELYNTTEAAIDLSGITLYYADGTTVGSGTNTATKDEQWKKIALTSSIPAGASYLILGPKQSSSGRYQIPENSGDINDNNFTLSNRAFKVALIRNTATLTAQNPFNMGSGAKAAGYIDMVGTANDYQGRDLIFGFETEPARNSASVAARRKNLTDNNNNANDFEALDYRVWSASNPDRMTAELLEVRKPRNSTVGKWNPFADPETPLPPEPTDNTLLIFQIGAATDGNISHSFVELYNNGETEINLSGYSLQYAEGTRETVAANRPNTATEDLDWNKIDLSGKILPRHSFLILGSEGDGQTASTNPALSLTGVTGDMNLNFTISNRSFKVVLLNNNTLLTASVQNPFDIDGEGAKASGYVDMVGAMNTVGEDKINGFETNAITNLNKQTGQRRTSLNDTDNNAVDFARATYSGASAANVELLRPKNLAHGAWNPITGESYDE